MGLFLNSKAPYETYSKLVRDPYFVDKSLLLAELVPAFDSINCYCCITRPRRFGKTVMANMIGAFFGKTDKKDRIFDNLSISKQKIYDTHLNRHDIIYIDFSRAPRGCGSYAQYIDRIENGMIEDLLAVYSDCGISEADSVWDALQKIYEQTDHKFLFVLDEWDAVFHMPFISAENQKTFLLFLKWLLKDQPYVEFAYMTGVLPIAKYSSGSELNMFVEYDMAVSEKFSQYFGFSDAEVDGLYEVYQRETAVCKFTREELRIWYDGYYTVTGLRLYNPRSVVLALTDNQLRNYWTSSGPYDELFYSEQMLKATLAGETKTMEDILQIAHDTESPVLSYNNETELAAIVNLCYLSARNRYRIERENKAGKGFADFIFYPERKSEDCIILELKVDSTPEEAIAQIKDRNYALCFRGKLGEEMPYTGRILAVGISYNKKTKKHSCRVEEL